MEGIDSINPYAPQLDPSTLTDEQRSAIQAVENQKSVTPGGELGKDEFLNLLVTQLSYQDPLNPMDSTESIAQLAQFSALEQMQNVSSQMELMRQSNGMTSALLLQGQPVEATLNNGMVQSGVVESIAWGRDGLALVLDNNTSIPMSSITGLKIVAPFEEDAEDPENEYASTDNPENAGSPVPEEFVENYSTPVENT